MLAIVPPICSSASCLPPRQPAIRRSLPSSRTDYFRHPLQLSRSVRTAASGGWWQQNPELWTCIRDQQSFDELLSSTDDVVLVDCYTQNCGGCKLIQPSLSRIAADDAFKDVTFAKVDTDDMRDFAKANSVRSLPYILLFRKGQGKLFGMQLSPYKLKLLRSALTTVLQNQGCSEFRLDPNGFVIPVETVNP